MKKYSYLLFIISICLLSGCKKDKDGPIVYTEGGAMFLNSGGSIYNEEDYTEWEVNPNNVQWLLREGNTILFQNRDMYGPIGAGSSILLEHYDTNAEIDALVQHLNERFGLNFQSPYYGYAEKNDEYWEYSRYDMFDFSVPNESYRLLIRYSLISFGWTFRLCKYERKPLHYTQDDATGVK